MLLPLLQNNLLARNDYTLTFESGTYTTTGNAVSLSVARQVSISAGAYAITGNAIGVTIARKIAIVTGAYSITGSVIGIAVSRALVFASGSYSITGGAIALPVTRFLSISAGSYSITGNAIALRVARVLSQSSGSYILTGNDLTLAVARALSIQFGMYEITGNDIELTVDGDPTITIDSGEYSLQWGDPTLTVTRVQPTGGGGPPQRRRRRDREFGRTMASRRKEYALEFESGAYRVKMGDVVFFVSRNAVSVASVVGIPPRVVTHHELNIDSGAYTLTPGSLSLRTSRTLRMASASYRVIAPEIFMHGVRAKVYDGEKWVPVVVKVRR